MALTWKGTKGPLLCRDEWQFDPSYGWNVEREYCGEKSVIIGYLNAFKSQNLRTKTHQEGPIHYVTVYYTYPDNVNQFTEKWTASTEPLEKDGFFHPNVNAELEAKGPNYRKTVSYTH